MPNDQTLSGKQRACLHEAKRLMDGIIKELPATAQAGAAPDHQSRAVGELAGHLGLDQFRNCMSRPSDRPSRR